jgi:hypothetical protein
VNLAITGRLLNIAYQIDHMPRVFQGKPPGPLIFDGIDKIRYATTLEKFRFRPLLGARLDPAADLPIRLVKVYFEGVTEIVGEYDGPVFAV